MVRKKASESNFLEIALRILSLMGRRTNFLVLAIIFGSIAAILSLGPYLAAAFALAELLKPTPDWPHIVWIATFGVASAIAEKLFFLTATTISHVIAFETQRDLRLRLAQKLERVSLGWFDGASKGEVRTAFIDDVEQLEDAMSHLVPEVSAALIAPMLAFLVMLAIDWRLAILLIIPLTLGVWLLMNLMVNDKDATEGYFKVIDRLAVASTELVDGLPTVRAFNQGDQAISRVRTAISDVTTFSDKWVRGAVAPGAPAQVLLSSHLLFAGPAGLALAAMNQISVTELALFLAVAYGFGDLFTALHGISHRMNMQAQLLDRIDAIECAEELPPPVNPKRPKDGSIVFENVDFAYGARPILNDISFEAKPGEFIALVGPSGSGKTTIARLTARFQDATKGSIKVGGVDVRAIDAFALHQSIAYVFQNVFLFGGSIADNIKLGDASANRAQVEAAATAARAHDFISRLPNGYDTIIGERGYGLSGGERQRISIARAILKNAPILILDEATAFSDPENEMHIQQGIANLAAGRTVLVIAHRLYTIAHADRILVLDQGRIVEQGDHSTLISQGGLYADQWRTQQGQTASVMVDSEISRA